MKLDERKVKSARERLGLSVVDAAKMIGISPNSLVSAEHGRDIRPGTARKIAAGFGLEVSDLYVEDSEGDSLTRLREVRDRFRPHAEALEAYCERFESGEEEPEKFFIDLGRKGFELGRIYTDELYAIADALGMVRRYGEMAVSGLPDEMVEDFARAEMNEYSLMRPALQRYYRIGNALAERVGDEEKAKQMQSMAHELEAA